MEGGGGGGWRWSGEGLRWRGDGRGCRGEGGRGGGAGGAGKEGRMDGFSLFYTMLRKGGSCGRYCLSSLPSELCRGDEERRGLMKEEKGTEIVYIAMKKIGMKQQ
jgi:hypothetical protein